ncbi:MAG: hypothetical protein IKC50_05170 [Oscillospiraceae bacterium]|nr:hypothetical protein [Oscillospiraceae bacterium]MBR2366534.1 hypothetical protein [Oscillospiraceae bacterium]MBR2977647.1 hypothetical protein [Oscillospiraceae bacterium]
MDKFNKIAKTAAGATADMVKINAQSLRELTQEEIFSFKIAACDTLQDRDFEHFTEAALDQMAELYIGKTVIFDHLWSAEKQTARIYDSYVEEIEDGKQLILLAYMLRTPETKSTIDAIEGGILREVSVGLSCRKRTCDICGEDVYSSDCVHFPGYEYDGVICTATLDDVVDVYELSFVAVPSQRNAGVVKSVRKSDADLPSEIDKADLAALELEKIRYV